MRLRETLVAYMLPLLVLPVMAFGYLAYEFSKQHLQKKAYYEVEQALYQQQLQLTTYLQQQQTRLAMLVQALCYSNIFNSLNLSYLVRCSSNSAALCRRMIISAA